MVEKQKVESQSQSRFEAAPTWNHLECLAQTPPPRLGLCQLALLCEKLLFVARAPCFPDLFLESCFSICFVTVANKLPELSLNRLNIQ